MLTSRYHPKTSSEETVLNDQWQIVTLVCRHTYTNYIIMKITSFRTLFLLIMIIAIVTMCIKFWKTRRRNSEDEEGLMFVDPDNQGRAMPISGSRWRVLQMSII